MDGTKTCPYCGKLASADAQFCQGCGRSISSPQQGGYEQPPQNYQQPPQQNYQAPPPYGMPAYGAPPVGYGYGGGAKGQIAGAVQNRNITDIIMSGIWALWPIVSVILAVIIGIVIIIAFWATMDLAGLVIGAVVALVIGIFLLALLNYKLLKRMDEHRKRETALRMGIISYLKEKGAEAQRAQLISNEISALESINQEAMYKEKERTPVLWTIISLIPLLNLIVMYFLGEYPFDHDKRWHAFTQYTQAACQKLGINVMTPSWSTLKERPNLILLIVILVLSVITITAPVALIVILYWYYIIIKDLNDHFTAQWQFEDQLMAQLR
ncbi:MAG: zinc ribbon domain-containing protein [Methanomassiliicoccales archaeon]|nr:zinc ribbon domain-containing protein [Methanomassiliicoccales archaeon]